MNCPLNYNPKKLAEWGFRAWCRSHTPLEDAFGWRGNFGCWATSNGRKKGRKIETSKCQMFVRVVHLIISAYLYRPWMPWPQDTGALPLVIPSLPNPDSIVPRQRLLQCRNHQDPPCVSYYTSSRARSCVGVPLKKGERGGWG